MDTENGQVKSNMDESHRLLEHPEEWKALMTREIWQEGKEIEDSYWEEMMKMKGNF